MTFWLTAASRKPSWNSFLMHCVWDAYLPEVHNKKVTQAESLRYLKIRMNKKVL